MKLLAIFLI